MCVEDDVPTQCSAAQATCHRSGNEKPSQCNVSYCTCWITIRPLNKFQTSGRLAMRASNVFSQWLLILQILWWEEQEVSVLQP